MGFLLRALDRLLPDPRPLLVFEIGDRALLGARRNGRTILARAERKLPARTASEGEGDPLAGLGEALRDLLRELGPLPSPHAAILLPDGETRLALFEFDSLPRRSHDLRRSVEERFRNSLPYDTHAARIDFSVQKRSDGPSVLAAAAATEYVRRCEREFERAGLIPGHVSPSSVAALNLVEDPGMALLVKLASNSMTMLAIDDGVVRLVRRVGLPADLATDSVETIREILADLFPTLVYIDENLGADTSLLRVAGPDELLGPALERLPGELGIPVEPLLELERSSDTCEAGLLGYVHGC